MDVLSTHKACDPWAVYTAKSFGEEMNGELGLTRMQTDAVSARWRRSKPPSAL